MALDMQDGSRLQSSMKHLKCQPHFKIANMLNQNKYKFFQVLKNLLALELVQTLLAEKNN